MKFSFLLALLFTTGLVFGQCPSTPITLTTQAQVDAFTTTYPNCTVIDSNFEISGSSIVDLTPLSVITGFNGALRIRENLNLPNLNGLENVTTIGLGLFIEQNFNLTSIQALQNASVSLGISVEDNFNLLSLTGLEGTTSVFSAVSIINNRLIENLVGLDNLESSLHLYIEENENLLSMEGLGSYVEADNTVRIVDNDALTTLEGLDSFTDALFFRVLVNDNLSQCSVESICNFLDPNTETQSFANNAPGCNSRLEVFDNCADAFNNITGYVRYDLDQNGCTLSDIGVDGVSVRISNTSGSIVVSTVTDATGFYRVSVGSGEYTLSLVEDSVPSYFSIDENDFPYSFVGIGASETQDFCISESATVNDVGIVIVPLAQPRPGFESYYKVFLQNEGTTPQDGEFTFFYDEEILDFQGAGLPVTSSTSNSLTFDYSSLLPFESRSVGINFTVFTPPTVEAGDILITEAAISSVIVDDVPENNNYTLEEIVVNSFDPNDKFVAQGTEITEQEVGNFLEYRIRFQNMGTADAINVIVADTLDSHLNWSTFRVLDASHSYEVEITQENEVAFIFKDINLPPQSQNEEESMGYVIFQIRSDEDLVIGDMIENRAGIYFDFNAPIITNTVTTTVVEILDGTDHLWEEEVVLYPNPTSNRLHIKAGANAITHVELYGLNGSLLHIWKDDIWVEGMDISKITAGIYFVRIYNRNRFTMKQFIKH